MTPTPLPFPRLCEAYRLADNALPPQLPVKARSQLLAELGYRPVAGTLLSKSQRSGLWRAWDDHRLRDLHYRQKHVLFFFTGVALAYLPTQPELGRAQLASALTLARSAWYPTPAPPAQPVEYSPRRPVWDLDTAPDAEDPTGDPEEIVVRTLEPLPPHRAGWQWFTLGQILDGLGHWEQVMQECLELPLGAFRYQGRLDHLMTEVDAVRQLPMVEAVFWLAA